jgi:hypothetical protein
MLEAMNINHFGKGEILTPGQINLLFSESFVNPCDKAQFGFFVCPLEKGVRRDTCKCDSFWRNPIFGGFQASVE